MGQLPVQGPMSGGRSRLGGPGRLGRGLLVLGCPVSVSGGVHQGVLGIFSFGCPFQVGFTRGRGCWLVRRCACIGGATFVMQTMVWPCVQLCRVRTTAATVSSRVAGGGALDSWMKVRASCARGAPARFVQAPVSVSLPCTTSPSGDCCWAFCMSFRTSWMYASVFRLSPVPVICWSVS